ncbi:hypothetical protein AVEN_37130-1, partial [Araneus ventricosus]
MSSGRIHYTPWNEYDFIRSRIILKKYFRTKKITEVAKSIKIQSLPFYDGFPVYTLHRTKSVTTEHWPTLLSTKYVDRALSFMAPGYGKGRKLFASELSNSDLISAIRTKHQRFASERSRDYIASAIETKNNFLSNDADHGLDDFIESAEDENSLSDSSEEILSRKKGHLINSGLTYNQNGNQMLIGKDTRQFNYEYSDTPWSQSILQNDQDFQHGSYAAIKNEEDKKTTADLGKIQIPEDDKYFDSRAYSTPETNAQVSDPLKVFHATITQGKDEINENQSEKQYAGSQSSYSLGKDFKLYDYLKNLDSNAKTEDTDKTSGQEENQIMKKHADLLPYSILGNIYKLHDYLKSLYTKFTSTDKQKPSPELNEIVSNQRKEHILPTVADAVTVSYTNNLSVNEEGSSDIGYSQLSEDKSFRLPRKRAHSIEAESDEAEEVDDDKEGGEDDDDKEAGEDDD